jgi:thymidylate synthase
MALTVVTGESVDDVMRLVLEAILKEGELVEPSKGKCFEIRGVAIELTNPRARLSRTETRGKPFSCLGELCWYLAGSNAVDFISYYIGRYREFSENGIIFGGYGPRLVNRQGVNQLRRVAQILSKNSASRRAVVQLFDAEDLDEQHEDIPCTCTLQFMVRDAHLHAFTYMRSNDAYLGLPHDIFAFTMFQEMLARELEVEVGSYNHMVGSMHLYETDKAEAEQFLGEGWQSTEKPMPSMPLGNPWPAVKVLLAAEKGLRESGRYSVSDTGTLDPYWADLIRMLEVHRYVKDSNCAEMVRVLGNMSSQTYEPYISRKHSECLQRSTAYKKTPTS